MNSLSFYGSDGRYMVSGSDDSCVKLWDLNDFGCKATLHGHITNVFATEFFPHKGPDEIISGGNDSLIIHYFSELGIATHYLHHKRKVLRICVNPTFQDTFMSCSFDGSIRLFDIRMNYPSTYTKPCFITPSELVGI